MYLESEFDSIKCQSAAMQTDIKQKIKAKDVKASTQSNKTTSKQCMRGVLSLLESQD